MTPALVLAVLLAGDLPPAVEASGARLMLPDGGVMLDGPGVWLPAELAIADAGELQRARQAPAPGVGALPLVLAVVVGIALGAGAVLWVRR